MSDKSQNLLIMDPSSWLAPFSVYLLSGLIIWDWKKVGKHVRYDKSLLLYQEFFKRFFSPGHDRVITIKSRNFSIVKVSCCMGWYWSTRGCNLQAHSSIHASFILRRGLTRFQLLLRPENNRVQEFFWYTGMRPGCHTGRKHHPHCSQSFVSPDWISPASRYLIAGNHRLSLLVHLSSLHHHSLGSINWKLYSCSEILFSVEVSAEQFTFTT